MSILLNATNDSRKVMFALMDGISIESVQFWYKERILLAKRNKEIERIIANFVSANQERGTLVPLFKNADVSDVVEYITGSVYELCISEMDAVTETKDVHRLKRMLIDYIHDTRKTLENTYKEGDEGGCESASSKCYSLLLELKGAVGNLKVGELK